MKAKTRSRPPSRRRIGMRISMCCPKCGSVHSIVFDTRTPYMGDYTRRRRVCDRGHRFTTTEMVVQTQKHNKRL